MILAIILQLNCGKMKGIESEARIQKFIGLCVIREIKRGVCSLMSHSVKPTIRLLKAF